MKSLNVLSCFDGISAGRVALDRAGIPVKNYFSFEIDKWAIQTAQKNYPDTVQLGDINDWNSWEFPRIDLLIGGSPCQGFSNAGERLNFDDPRSALFFTFVDILQALRPRYFLLENVKMKKEWRDIITEWVGVEPILINSSLVSAQNRERYYWTNIKGITQPEDKGLVLQDVLEDGFVDRETSYCIDANYYRGNNIDGYKKKHRRQLVLVGQADLKDDEWRKLTPVECERLQTFPDNYTAGVSNTQRYKQLGNSWTVDVIAHIFSFIPRRVR